MSFIAIVLPAAVALAFAYDDSTGGQLGAQIGIAVMSLLLILEAGPFRPVFLVSLPLLLIHVFVGNDARLVALVWLMIWSFWFFVLRRGAR